MKRKIYYLYLFGHVTASACFMTLLQRWKDVHKTFLISIFAVRYRLYCPRRDVEEIGCTTNEIEYFLTQNIPCINNAFLSKPYTRSSTILIETRLLTRLRDKRNFPRYSDIRAPNKNAKFPPPENARFASCTTKRKISARRRLTGRCFVLE